MWKVVQTSIATIAASPRNITAIAGAVAGILTVVYAKGLLWKVLKFLLQALGWWVLFRVIAKVIETVVIPEAEIVELLASFTVWAIQTVNSALNVQTACAPAAALATGP